MNSDSRVADRSSHVATIRAGVAALRASVPYTDGHEVSAALADVTALVAELESLRLQLVSRIEATEVWRDDPNGTANSWLRANHCVDHRTAKADLAAARALRSYPSLAAAAAAGVLSRAHIDTIVSVGEANPTRRQMLGEFLDAFIEVGRNAPASVLRTVMRAWADQIDPLGTARDEQEAHSRRYLHVNQVADGYSSTPSSVTTKVPR